MDKILAIIGWRYVKDFTKSKFHYYKCHELKGSFNKKTYRKEKMLDDLARHPYSLGTCKCLEELV